MVVRVESRVGAKSVVEVAEDLLVGQERVLSLERVRRRVEEHLHEVGFDYSTPENYNIFGNLFRFLFDYQLFCSQNLNLVSKATIGK